MEKNYKEYLQDITTLIFDVDGVLTDGTISITTQGEMYRTMHTKDGYALKAAFEQGLNVCIISGGTNEGVRLRLKGLGLKDVFLGAHNKTEIMSEYLKKNNTTNEQVLYMGDDIPDLYVMQEVGLPCCPQDAVQELKLFQNMFHIKKEAKDVLETLLNKY